MNHPDRKTKIAILGGGIAGLTAAYELISQPQGPDRYDVTVYQMGWRLGGKGASGRNPDAGDRVEEHGLHVWSGFYENAFHLMRRCYPQLRRVPGKDPLATVFPVPDQPAVSPAFRQHNCVVIQEFIKGQWLDWVQPTPSNTELPGSGKEMSLWDYFQVAVGWLVDLVEGLISPNLFASASTSQPLPVWVEAIVKDIQSAADLLVGGSQDALSAQAVPAGPVPPDETSPFVVMEREFVQLARDITSKLGAQPARPSRRFPSRDRLAHQLVPEMAWELARRPVDGRHHGAPALHPD